MKFSKKELIDMPFPLFSNNQRKMFNLPLLRKTNNKRRYYTRCKAMEDTGAMIAYMDGKEVRH